MNMLKQYILMFMLLALGLSSCLREEFISGYEVACTDSEKDMYLRVTVPRTYASGAIANKETAIETLDMIVFAPGVDDKSKYYVKSASQGTVVEGAANRFQVIMPVGENFIVHVFTNSHDELVQKGFFKSAGTEMEALLSRLAVGMEVSADLVALPMYGFRAGVTISKDDANKDIDIPLLRAVAAVQVTANATIDNTGATPVITPGQLADADGNVYFELRELYAYFQQDSARLAPLADSYEPEVPATKGITRDVTAVSLPQHRSVKDKDGKIFIKESDPVDMVGCLYLYENMHYTENGYDTPGSVPGEGNSKVATTRLVVGGVYKGDNASETKVTYYRVDFAETGKLVDILRNHKYTFNITNVTGPGYDNPDDAATGVPVNIVVKLIDWANDINNADFDRENYFYAQTKSLVLPRNVGAYRTIKIESDVPFGGNWEMGFDTEGNGKVTPIKTGVTDTEATITNSRYKIHVTAGKMTVTTLKAYADLTGTETYADKFYIRVKNLKVNFDLSQVDKSADDWGNGGSQGDELSQNGEYGSVDGAGQEEWKPGNGGGTLDTEMNSK